MFKSFEQPLSYENTAEVFKQKTRVIVMLGARFFQEGRGNGLPPRFPLVLESLKEGMPKEVVGGDVRMRAIEQLYKEFEENHAPDEKMKIFTTGGIEKITLPDSDEVLEISRAEQAEHKLEEKYHVPEALVETLPSGGSTLGNAKVLADLFEQNKEEYGDIEEIEIVTNEFHMSRAWLMFTLAIYKNKTGKDFVASEELREAVEKLLDDTLADSINGDQEELKELQRLLTPYTKELPLQVKPMIAEEVLKRRGPGGEKYGQLIRENEYVQQTRGFERQGIKDLLSGKYQVK